MYLLNYKGIWWWNLIKIIPKKEHRIAKTVDGCRKEQKSKGFTDE